MRTWDRPLPRKRWIPPLFGGPRLLGDVARNDNNGGAATNTVTTSHVLAAGTGRRVFILAGWDDTGVTATAVSTCTYGGVTCSRVTDGTQAALVQASATNQNGAEVWELRDASLPADGANNAVVTLDQTVDVMFVGVVSLQNATQDTNAQDVTVDPDTASGNHTDLSITPTASESMILSFYSVSSDTAVPLTTSNNVSGQGPAHDILERAVTQGASSGAFGASIQEVHTAEATAVGWDAAVSVARWAHIAISLGKFVAPPALAFTRKDRVFLPSYRDLDPWVGWG